LVFTSDLASPWTAEWRPWASFGSLWTQMVRWTSRRIHPEQLLHPHITLQGTTARLLVEAFEDNGRFRNFLHLRALIHPPAAVPQAVQLHQTASGRYEGHFEVDRTGTYLLSLTATEPAAREPLQTAYTSLHVATLPEYQTVHANLPLLHELARTAGGAVLTLQENPFRRPASGTTYVDAWQFPVILALLIFILDVALRRGIRLRDLRLWRREGGKHLTGVRLPGQQ
jgi:Ca-activated chloride channel homolog